MALEDRCRAVDHVHIPIANIVFPHPADAVAVAHSSDGEALAVEHVSPGDWLQVGPRLFGGAQVPVGVAAHGSRLHDVIVFLDPDGFDAFVRAGAWGDACADLFDLCAARSGERVALCVDPEPSPAGLVLMDDEVRALAGGARLMVGEAAEERRPAQLDRAAAVPLPASRVRGVVEAVDLL